MKLPDKPSELIKVAVKDMKAAIDKGLLIDMSEFGRGTLDNIKDCAVCFAGSVLLNQFNETDPDEFQNLVDEMEGDDDIKIAFLDHIRSGELTDGMEALGIEHPHHPYVMWSEFIDDWENYENTTEKRFYNQLEKLAKYLETLGL